MNEPLISVIVPVYNVEKYLSKCVDSLVNQTYKNYEIILVDDGSPDDCGKICDKYAENYRNIKVIHQQNQGLSVARNNGVKYSIGEYISFVDSDDYVAKDYLECLVNALCEFDADVSVGGRVSVNENEVIKEDKYVSIDRTICLSTEKALSEMCYAKSFGVSAWSKLYPRTLVEKYPYPIGMVHEDLATTYKIIADCKKIAVSEKPIYYYVQRAESTMHCTLKENHLKDGLKAAKNELEYMEKNFKEVVVAAKYRCCLKVIEYIPRLLNGTKQDKMYFSRLQKELKPFINTVLRDKNASLGFKIRCAAIMSGYIPTFLLWKTIDKIKGRKVFKK